MAVTGRTICHNIQYIEEAHFAALISALHRCSQANLPLTLVGAGLPQLRGLAGDAKSYAERLFDFPMIGALSPDEARRAILKPAHDEGVDYTPFSNTRRAIRTSCRSGANTRGMLRDEAR